MQTAYDSGAPKRHQLRELLVVTRSLLRRRLELDVAARAGHDDVHVDVSTRIFLVRKIEHGAAIDHADADGRNRIAERGCAPDRGECEVCRNPRAGD